MYNNLNLILYLTVISTEDFNYCMQPYKHTVHVNSAWENGVDPNQLASYEAR